MRWQSSDWHSTKLPNWGLLCLGIILLVLVGCRSNTYLEMRKVPKNPLDGPLQLLSRSGPAPTERTRQVLRRYNLPDDLFDQKTLDQLQREVAQEPSQEKIYALAELSYVVGTHSKHLGRKQAAMHQFGTAVAYAYLYLFDPMLDQARNPYDPHFRQACDLYNKSLEETLRILSSRGDLSPGNSVQVNVGDAAFNLEIASLGRWQNDDFERIEFVSDYELTGLRNRHYQFGLGVPLIAVRKPHPDSDPSESYYPDGLSFPVTAFLRVHRSLEHHEPVQACRLELHDPLQSSEIQIAGRRVPLETDLTTPLAFTLNDRRNQSNFATATLGLLDPQSASSNEGLYMVEPYVPEKIPVLMVHGLWSSPTTWMEMFNDLRAFPEIRDRYQFWFYLYPTGEPFWTAAAQLRNDLQALRQSLDPHQQNVNLDRMVLVGHSMGGLVSKLQTIHSDNEFWSLLSEQPFEQLQASPEEKQQIAQVVFFQPNQSIRRVISIGTPHRGSEFANGYTRYLASKLIRLPEMLTQRSNSLVARNPEFFRDTALLTKTSIDSLSPDSDVFPRILEAEPASWTRYHNIVGVMNRKSWVSRLSEEGDGVVAYASAHLDQVDSEIVVDANHVSVHTHPKSILEVRRILLEHLRDVNQGLGYHVRRASAEQAGHPAASVTDSLEPQGPAVSHGF